MIAEALCIAQLDVCYRMQHRDAARRARLDRVLNERLPDALSAAAAAAGVGEYEQICVREVSARVHVREGASEHAIAQAWALSLWAGLERALAGEVDANVVRYASRLRALIDLVASVATRQTQRSWAWRQLGLWTARSDASEQLATQAIAALLREPELIMAVLVALPAQHLRSVLRAFGAQSTRGLALAAAATISQAACDAIAAWMEAADQPSSQSAVDLLERSRIALAFREQEADAPTRELALFVLIETDPGRLLGPGASVVADLCALATALDPQGAAPSAGPQPSAAQPVLRGARAVALGFAHLRPHTPFERFEHPAVARAVDEFVPGSSRGRQDHSAQEFGAQAAASPQRVASGDHNLRHASHSQAKGAAPVGSRERQDNSTRAAALAARLGAPERSRDQQDDYARSAASAAELGAPERSREQQEDPTRSAHGPAEPDQPGRSHALQDDCTRSAHGAAELAQPERSRERLANSTLGAPERSRERQADSTPASLERSLERQTQPTATLAVRQAQPSAAMEARSSVNAAEAAANEISFGARASGHTRAAGLLFLLHVVRQLDLPERFLAASAEDGAPARTLRWAFSQLALTLLPLEARDPAALAFAGLVPGSEPPSSGGLPPTRRERALFTQFASEILDVVRHRLDPTLTPLEARDRVCLRKAKLVADPGWFEVRMELADVDLAVRRAQLDLDPGFVPWLGTIVRFVYA